MAPRRSPRPARLIGAAALCIGSLLAASTTQGQYVPFDPFAQGRVRVSLLAGGGYAGGHSYLVLGGGVGYFLLDGLEAGADVDAWFLGDPTILNVSPQVRYVFHFVPVLKPYLGTFYRHAFVFGRPDLNSIGGRVGAFYVADYGAFFGGGVAYERWLDCDAATFRACDSIYPEIVVAFAF